MSEIPKEAVAKAKELLGWETLSDWTEAKDNVASYIADVSEKAGKAFDLLGGVDDAAEARGLLLPLILPNPEDDQRQEAREICALVAEANNMPGTAEMYRLGELDTNAAMRRTLAALKGRK